MAEVTLKLPTWLIATLTHMSYPSSWKSLVGFATVAGVIVDPTLADKIAVIGAGVISGIAFLWSDADVVPPKTNG